MPEFVPFRALRYNPALVDASKAVTQPYDKITSEMQARYYDSSPYNLVRIILGRAEPADDEQENVYSRATRYFRDWRANGVLTEDRSPSIYIYSQQFTIPGTSEQAERRGFIAASRIYDYSEKVVFRHEQTLAKPKTDRLNLLRATRAHCGQIFMLYSDPQHETAPLLHPPASPVTTVRDEYGVLHQLWTLSDPQAIGRLQQLMLEKKLIIADGHHRYETALNYRNERRAGCECKQPQPLQPYDYAMMTFINMDSAGLVILPTHRVLSGLSSQQKEQLLPALDAYFSRTDLAGSDVSSALHQLSAAGKNGTSFLLATANSFHLLIARPDKISAALAGLSPRQRQLDIVVLHRLVLEKVLGLSEESIRNQQNISYYRDAAEAIARVRSSAADLAFFVNPVRISEMRDVAFAGEVMPQKSTDFYPKLLSGLTIYALD